VHAALIGASLAIGTTAGVLGIRAWRTASRRRVAPGDESNVARAATGESALPSD
jgi:uncharacterized membrane protein